MAAIANPKHRNLLVTLTLTAFVVVACISTDGAQRRDGSRSRIEKADGLYAALQEPVPAIVLHQAVFGRPVQLSSVRPLGLDDRGALSAAPVALEYASSGVVIGKDHRAFRVDIGDAVAIGDFIVGGVVENVGSTSVYLFYADGGEIQLDPGERLYVGTEARILEPAGAEGGVAAREGVQEPVLHVDADGRAVLAPGPSPEVAPSHCAECKCQCSGNNCSCAITIGASIGFDCGKSNGTSCVCSSTCSGRTQGCFLRFVPCAS